MLDKTVSPAEADIYRGWEESGAFAANPGSPAAPYTIMVPPPNVTGSLHVGHALTFTLQDTLIRWRRMQGRDALWQPGTDHAGIATQMVVERLLDSEGKKRRTLGREAFLDRVWAWRAESGGTITRQLRRLGASLDWPRERFTMDDGLSRAVREVFVTLYREGLIYRDHRLVNWDPQFQSALSDLEVESKRVQGHLWHIGYPIADEPGLSITVATTRPETLLGDTAIAVHPEDERYRHLIGRQAILPLVGRRITIIADSYSDPEKGTGAVKITPAHDFNDFAVGQRHGLDMPSVLDREARVTIADIEDRLVEIDGIASPDFVRSLAGQTREAARRAIVAELDRLGLLVATEPHPHDVPHGDRSGVPIEPLLTTQWYCNAGVLAKPAVEAVEQGRIKFVPKQWENTFFAWMREIEPWCISRQLWWGHRIPAWYGPDGEVFVAGSADEAAALAHAHYGAPAPLVQDEDVLDTWFSSALWPFSTLGWPDKTAELARYYPTDVLVTGFDIIFFWVARMMMMGLHFMGDVPFRTVCIHGLVRDERGQKMSKSKGNVLDPLSLIDQYGADALRFAIVSLTGPGRDIKLGEQAVKSNRSFVTKIWNAARFCEMNGVTPPVAFDPASVASPLGRWVLACLNDAVAEATAALEAFRFADYAQAAYRFTWGVFCDWFLELAKPVFAEGGASADELRAVTGHTLGAILRLLHPAMPFVTETLWDEFAYGPPCSLIGASWPTEAVVANAEAARAELDWVVRANSELRAVRAEMGVPPSAKIEVRLRDAAPETLARAARWREAFERLSRVTGLGELSAMGQAAWLSQGAVQIVLDEATLVLPLAGVVDLAAERARLERERGRAAGEAEKLARKLDNADFVARADPAVVDEQRDRVAAARAEVSRLDAALQRIA